MELNTPPLKKAAITASAQSLIVDVSDYSNLMIAMNTASLSGHNCIFEGSLDGTNWTAIAALRSNSAIVESVTGAFAATPAYFWEASVNGFNMFRVRCTAHTSGTANWQVQSSLGASEPNPIVRPFSALCSRAVSAASTNATSVKAAQGTLYSISASNEGAAAAFLKLYNKASAPTVGTDQPAMTIVIPANNSIVLEYGTVGELFSVGIAYAITNLIAYTDTTVIAANQVRVNVNYY